MDDPILGSLTPTDPAKVLAKAAEKLGVPVPPSDEARVERMAIAIYSLGNVTAWPHSLSETIRQFCRAQARAAIAAYEAP